MKVVTMIDSMKGSLTSREAGEIVSQAFSKIAANVRVIEVSDGGEGFDSAFINNFDGEIRTIDVINLAGETTQAAYGWLS